MSPKTSRRTTLGFTLVETLAALSASAELTAFGAPQLSALVQARAVDAALTPFASALRLAKSEAMKRGEPVSVCALDDSGQGGTARCTGAGVDWRHGWMVFVDRGQAGHFGSADVLIKVHQAGKNGPEVKGTLHHIRFQATGVSINAAAHFDFMLGGKADVYGAKRVCLSKPGRLRTLPNVTDCTS